MEMDLKTDKGRGEIELGYAQLYREINGIKPREGN